MLSVNFAIPLLTMVLIPGAAAILLMGPLRKAGRREVLRLWAGYFVIAAILAVIAAATRPQAPLDSALAIAALALGPVAGITLGLRAQGVQDDPRLGFILGPLGYLAGCALAVRAIMALGFAT